MSNLSPKYQKDFRKSDFKNPRVIKEKKQTKRTLIIAILILIGISILGITGYVLFSPKFQIQNLEITGINKISKEKFNKIVDDYRFKKSFLIFSHNNYFLFSPDDLKALIGTSYLLEKIEIEKSYPSSVKISVFEKNAQIVWLSGDRCFELDEQGNAIESCDDRTKDLIRIHDLSGATIEIGKQAIDHDFLAYLLKADELLKNTIPVEIFNLNDGDKNTIKMQTKIGYEILINRDLDIAEQVSRLLILLNDNKIKEQLPQIRYFDLRFGEKVFYK
jgi:cell division septal protein FtsQ